MIPLDPAALEAAAKVLAFRDLAADPDWHGVYEEEWAAQPEEYREAWRESVREVLDPYLAAAVPAPTTENREDSFLTAGGCRVSADDCDRAGLSAAAHTLRLAAEYLDRNRPSFAVRRALQKLHDTGLLDVGTATGVALAAAQHATGENPYAGKAGALAVAWGEGFAAGRAAATPDPQKGNPDYRLREQLNAVDEALGPWQSAPGSETGVVGRVQTIRNLRAAATPDPQKDERRPWPIAPDTVMPPRRQPVRWGSRADDPPTEIHDDPGKTKAYLAGLAAGRTEAAAASPDDVGAGMPCGQCGNPLTPGQPHKCGRVGNPYAPSADWKPGQDTFTSQAAGIWDEGFAAGRAAATPDPPSDRNVARMFHEAYERLAPEFGYHTREESAVPWERVPARNRDLMTATVGEVRAHLAAASPDERLREAGETLLDAYDAWADDRSDGEFALWSYDAIHNGVAALRAALAAADREKPSAGSDGEDR